MEISKQVLLEISNRRFIIRKLVSDVVTIYKENEEGEFYLPEDIDGNHAYIFPKLKNPLQVELTIFPDDEVNDFIIDADYFNEESIIAITIVYDPEKKLQLLYNIVGELNEIIAHEIRHSDQHRQNMYNIDYDEIEKIESDPIKYYTQPHELDAQVYGFKRLSKLRKKPFEEIVKNWFETHKDIHGMEENEYQFVINKIIEEKNKN